LSFDKIKAFIQALLTSQNFCSYSVLINNNNSTVMITINCNNNNRKNEKKKQKKYFMLVFAKNCTSRIKKLGQASFRNLISPKSIIT